MICLLLWGAERWRDSRLLAPLVVFGRVPLFFYVAHLYVIHALPVVAALLTHQPTGRLFHGAIFGPEPDSYGFGLPVVYAVWVLVVLLLYWPCKRMAALKQSGRYRWLGYAQREWLTTVQPSPRRSGGRPWRGGCICGACRRVCGGSGA